MTPATSLTFDGIEQPVTEWALDYGILPAVILARLERGLSVEQAITTPMVVAPGQTLPDKCVQDHIRSQRAAERELEATAKIAEHEARRAEWGTRRAEREALQLSKNDERAAVKAERELRKVEREAIRLAKREEREAVKSERETERALIRQERSNVSRPLPRARTYTLNGNTLTLRQWAEQTGIPKITIYCRIRRGCTLERALSACPQQDDALTYCFDDETLTLRQWAEQTGIPRSAIKTRLFRGWSLERALTEPVGTRAATVYRRQSDAKRYSLGGTTMTVKGWAAKLGIQPSSVSLRLRRWPLERALTIPAMTVEQCAQHARNAKTIRRMLTAINASMQTNRGVVGNFTQTFGTGVGSLARDLQSEKLNG